MRTDEEFILERLSDPQMLYLKKTKSTCKMYPEVEKEMTLDFLALYRVDEITFEDQAPRKEALENVIASMNIYGVNFVYMIIGNTAGVSFYYGVARDFSLLPEDGLCISDIGEKILSPSLQGNFRGSVITEVGPDERKSILEEIDSLKEAKILEGVPGINKDDEKFQSVDRIIDVMLGDKFALMLIAKPVSVEEINILQNRTYHLYNSLAPLGKTSVQESSGNSRGSSESTTKGTSLTKGSSHSTSNQSGSSSSQSHTSGSTTGKNRGTSYNSSGEKTSKGGSEGTHDDKSFSDSSSSSDSKSKSETTGGSESTSNSDSNTESTQSGTNSGSAATIEVVNKRVQDWIKYMEEVILPRMDYGLGKGLFITSTFLLGDNPASLIKLENTIRSVYGGESGNRMPLHAFSTNLAETKLLKRMQIPQLDFESIYNESELDIRTVCSQLYLNGSKALLGNWMSSQEVSLLAGLPQKEVVGMSLREEVEFGLNVTNKSNDSFILGHLVQSGVVLNGKNGMPDIPVYFDSSYFDKHIFVTGVTGGGKTTTCQKLLLASKSNFLVIEPAKTEYRVLAETDVPDMLVFTLGKETGAPFRLNPFEFFEGENITSRVDMVKASMEAAFDMEAAIPQLLETAIYECYEDKGWDISTNKNTRYDDPFADGVFSFPTLGDLENKIEKVVKDQGFDSRLRDEYIGSMRARLKGLTVGAKGLMLNTPRSVDFVELLDKKVVLELESIKSAAEKSLIMGFILTNLSEAIRVKYNQNEKKPIRHLTLIEEAHRLLSKYMPGDSMNKKQGVEMFSDMLAEVRKYGESLIIADQIPNKLTPEVLKNTNTKIVHRIFAQDDKDAIGNTMALKDEQKEHLSYLTSGRAIMMNPGLSKAIQIQILQTEENNTERPPLEDEFLRDKIIEYYCSVYKKGILPGLETLDEIPTKSLVRLYLNKLQPKSKIIQEYFNCIHTKKVTGFLVGEIKNLRQECNLRTIARIVCCSCCKHDQLIAHPEIYEYCEGILSKISEIGETYNVRNYEHYCDLEDRLERSGF